MKKRAAIYGGMYSQVNMFALYIRTTYNICHEEITCGYNCSIDGRGEVAAPSAVRGNGHIANRCSGACDSTNGESVKGEKVMDITYYPNGKSNEGFEIGHIVNNMRVRWYKCNGRLMTKVKPHGDRCAHCGSEGGWKNGAA